MTRNSKSLFFSGVICLALGVFAPAAQAVSAYPITKIAIIVDSRIYPSISTKVTAFINALISVESMNSGNIILDTRWDKNTPKETIRSTLKGYYTSNGIEGAILIGDITRVTFEDILYWHGAPLGRDEGSVDFYYMDLTYTADPWQDNNTDPSFLPGVFDKYVGDGRADIWVSRIMAQNFTQFSDVNGNILIPISITADEAKVINDYLQRTVDRMTTASALPEASFLMVDDGDPEGATQAAANLDMGTLLEIPKHEIVGNPNDIPDNWKAYLRASGDNGFTWAYLSEHGGPAENAFHCYHNLLSFFTGDYVAMPVGGGAPSQTLFYNMGGCKNVDVSQTNSIGQAYAMGQHGLICLGKSQALPLFNEATYYSCLGRGTTFGRAFVTWMNTSSASIFMHLVGAGTLRGKPYVPYVNDAVQIRIDSVSTNVLTTERPGRQSPLSVFAHVSCPSTGFDPGTATYTWKIEGNTYTGNPINNIAVSATWDGTGTLKVTEGGFLQSSKTLHILSTCLWAAFDVIRSVGPCQYNNDFPSEYPDAPFAEVKGYPSGTGRVCADNSPDDMNDNFLYSPVKEPLNSVQALWNGAADINPAISSAWDVGYPAQQGIMIRETDANGITTPGAPYVCLYFSTEPGAVTNVYFQYRTVANGHAHKQLIASNPGCCVQLILERSGSQIIGYTQNIYQSIPKTQVGTPQSFTPQYSQFMLFFSGRSNIPAEQYSYFHHDPTVNHLYLQYNLLPPAMLQFKNSGITKANTLGWNLCLAGIDHTGALSGLKFSNAASITSAGDLIRSSARFNLKSWLTNNSNLLGGLVFRNPSGVPIFHISTGGVVTVGGGVLGNTQY
jgi:hypothetical protein